MVVCLYQLQLRKAFPSYYGHADTGRASTVRKVCRYVWETAYQTVFVKKMQNVQRISSKNLYTEFLCVNILAILNVYYEVLQ